MTALEFFDDPQEFLDAAGEWLAREPVRNVIVIGVTTTMIRRAAVPETPCWWAVVHDEQGAVVGAAMRTAPFAPYPAYLLAMPDDAAVALARAVHERGEQLTQLNGARPAVDLAAAELARLSGTQTQVAEHQRLFELRELVAPRPASGRPRVATAADLDRCVAWFEAFLHDAAEQAGHAAARLEATAPEEVAQRIEEGLIWLWEDDGDVVHLTCRRPAQHGVAAIGPVYTPPERRGRGYASALVAHLSQGMLADGVRPCLFTDQANPVSNRIYQALGYEALVDTINVRLV